MDYFPIFSAIYGTIDITNQGCISQQNILEFIEASIWSHNSFPYETNGVCTTENRVDTAANIEPWSYDNKSTQWKQFYLPKQSIVNKQREWEAPNEDTNSNQGINWTYRKHDKTG